MALGVITDPDALSQGAETVVTDMVFGTPTGNQVTVTSAGNNLPVLVDNEFIEIRDHSVAVNNGLYQVDDASPSDTSVTLDKVSGSDPLVAGSESASTFSSIRNAETVTFANQSGRAVDMTGTGLPSLAVGARFDIEDHSDADNNGTYAITTVNTDTSDYTCRKLGADADPNDGASEALVMVTDGKTVHYETSSLKIFLLEQWGMDLDGVTGQAFYSFTSISWKDDPYLIAAAPFPMLTIDSDAGKYLIGQDPGGNNSGWAFEDDVAGFGIRTRKLPRNMGWTEVAADGSTDAEYSGVRTLGAMLDPTAGTGDLAYYQFGTDTTVDDTVDFEFNGPVNEAIQVYNGLATPADAGTGFAIATTDTISRNDGGNWRDDGYVVGGQIEIFDAEDPANDGTWLIASVQDATDGDLVVTGVLTDNAADNTLRAAVDNRNAVTLRLRVRTTAGDTNARTFSQADLASAGETILSNRLFTFGLSNAQDLDITETDANIDGNAPYTGMTLTYYAAPQSLGGSGDLVGGPYNFGIVIAGNSGTNTQVYEWVQRQLRKATDIDNDADTAIGKSMDGLMRFVGPTLQVGSVDGGLTFPINPDGGGSGVYITSLAAASSNDTVYYDNLGTLRNAPITVSVTLDFNQTAIDDTVAAYTLFYDRTIRTNVSDLIVTAGTLADGTFDSAGANLPSLDVGANQYIRISGLTGADEPMNGVYQVTTETSTSQWDVTRWDGATIVTTSSAAVDVDEHCIDTPDAIIVEDSSNTDVTGLASADFNFNYDRSNNIQGGRPGGTDAFVQARLAGQTGAQFTQSSVQTIATTALTIPLAAAIERNFNNP